MNTAPVRIVAAAVVGLGLAVATGVAQEKKDAPPAEQKKPASDPKDTAPAEKKPADGKQGGKPVTAATAASVLDFTMKDIDGKDVALAKYKGKVILIVNVASQCGLTPQYEQLEALNKKYRDQGLSILGFPANNFGSQEPGTDSEIKQFCTSKFNVSFDMFSKISVKGDDQHDLYKFLTSKEKNPAFTGEIEWNFTKFLIDRNGKVIARFGPRVKPDAEEVTKAIDTALAAKP